MSKLKKLVDEQIQNFLNKFDKDKNGEVSYEECVSYWRSQGVKDPEHIANVIFIQYDKNKDSKIRLDELKNGVVKLAAAYTYSLLHELNLATFLSRFDKNNDDKISFDELENEYKRSGSKDPKAAAEWIYHSMDKKSDATITMDDLTKFFEKIDPKKMGTYNAPK
ncbi:hypothetical protein CYY_002034 [Polysphondylium violaceum]|uniref:EF-hand domain-containing protein n=1 Tax=Polysphondylium violaceum TaxID=133409 RepID=A0A8J4VA07_9MYCE|nr:hypothetical protein CYY_002034 [Polysphondylium violaceum]